MTTTRRIRTLGLSPAITAVLAGCTAGRTQTTIAPPPDLSPASQPSSASALKLDRGAIEPLYREVVAIDLEAVSRTALAQNLDIRAARQQVEVQRGAWESAAGSVIPLVTINAPFEHVDGGVRAVQGNIVGAAFNTFQLYAAAQWITNPGSVIYQMVAARKRLGAAEHEEAAVVLETLRTADVQFYALALAQLRVGIERQAVQEAEELLRVARIRVSAGTSISADELRAASRLAEFQGNLVRAIDEFYRASVTLAVTLRLDATVTLVPKMNELSQITLVRSEIDLNDLIEIAIAYRPDLKRVRALAEQAAALRGASWWGNFGPQFALGYQYGGITGHADNVAPGKGIPNNLILNPASPTGAFNSNPLVNGLTKEAISEGSSRLTHSTNQTSGFDRTERFTAGAGWRFSVAAFGELRAARATEELALVAAQREYEQARAQVTATVQSTRTQAELVRLTEQQTAAADEALRLAQANFQAGTFTALDVLEAEDAANQARLRRAEAIVGYNQAQINLLAGLGLSGSTQPGNSNGH